MVVAIGDPEVPRRIDEYCMRGIHGGRGGAGGGGGVGGLAEDGVGEEGAALGGAGAGAIRSRGGVGEAEHAVVVGIGDPEIVGGVHPDAEGGAEAGPGGCGVAEVRVVLHKIPLAEHGLRGGVVAEGGCCAVAEHAVIGIIDDEELSGDRGNGDAGWVGKRGGRGRARRARGEIRLPEHEIGGGVGGEALGEGGRTRG